jgi:hypothetical protein
VHRSGAPRVQVYQIKIFVLSQEFTEHSRSLRMTAKLSCQLRLDGQTFLSLLGIFSKEFAPFRGESGQTFL